MLLFFRWTVNNVMPFLQSCDQLGHLFRRMLQVVIHGNEDLVTGLPDPAQQGIVLAVIAQQVDRPDPRMLRRELMHDRPAVIGAAIVDQDAFIRVGQRGQHLAQGLDQGGQAFAAPVDRNHDRDARFQLCVGGVHNQKPSGTR